MPGRLAMPWLIYCTASKRVISCSCRKNAAWLSRSAKIATSTLAPVTSSRPEDCTCTTARWITRWKPVVGWASVEPLTNRPTSSLSRYSVMRARNPSRSTEHARITAEASRSSSSDNSRCSSVAYSCGDRWHVRWRDVAPLPDSERMRARARLLLFHGALQRMLVLAREVHHLCNLGLCDLVGIDAADAHPLLVHVQHNPGCFFPPLVEEALQYEHDELHRRIVVVKQKHLVEARLLGLRPRLGDKTGLTFLVASRAVLAGHTHENPCRPSHPYKILPTACPHLNA